MVLILITLRSTNACSKAVLMGGSGTEDAVMTGIGADVAAAVLGCCALGVVPAIAAEAAVGAVAFESGVWTDTLTAPACVALTSVLLFAPVLPHVSRNRVITIQKVTITFDLVIVFPASHSFLEYSNHFI
jgi:hypothetical protein